MVADLSLLGTRSQWKKRTVGQPTVSMLLVMWQGSNTFVEKSGPAGHLWSQEGAVFVGQCQHFRVRNMCGKFTICGHCECCQMSDITYSSELFVVKKAASCSLQVYPTAWCDCLCCEAIESAAAPLIDIYSQQEAASQVTMAPTTEIVLCFCQKPCLCRTTVGKRKANWAPVFATMTKTVPMAFFCHRGWIL